jgi:hypothetical protein
MSQKDLMKEWLKELPSEEPSPDFTVKVMQRVMTEWTLNPIKYQPIISKKGWWTMGFVAILLTSFLFLLHSSLPAGSENAEQSKSLYGIDLVQLITPISQLFEKLTTISPAVAIGALAIIALWFFDQIFVKTVRH